MSPLRRLLGLSRLERALLAEAAVELTLASIILAVRPFRDIIAGAAQTPPSPRRAPPEIAAGIGWAVRAVADRLPWRPVCFPRGLAAHAMLRRRGFHSALHYGARRDEAGALAAHVWVKSGDLDVTGCEDVDRYGLLAMIQA